MTASELESQLQPPRSKQIGIPPRGGFLFCSKGTKRPIEPFSDGRHIKFSRGWQP